MAGSQINSALPCSASLLPGPLATKSGSRSKCPLTFRESSKICREMEKKRKEKKNELGFEEKEIPSQFPLAHICMCPFSLVPHLHYHPSHGTRLLGWPCSPPVGYFHGITALPHTQPRIISVLTPMSQELPSLIFPLLPRLSCLFSVSPYPLPLILFPSFLPALLAFPLPPPPLQSWDLCASGGDVGRGFLGVEGSGFGML